MKCNTILKKLSVQLFVALSVILCINFSNASKCYAIDYDEFFSYLEYVNEEMIQNGNTNNNLISSQIKRENLKTNIYASSANLNNYDTVFLRCDQNNGEMWCINYNKTGPYEINQDTYPVPTGSGTYRMYNIRSDIIQTPNGRNKLDIINIQNIR